jgi:hypothetical protein
MMLVAFAYAACEKQRRVSSIPLKEAPHEAKHSQIQPLTDFGEREEGDDCMAVGRVQSEPLSSEFPLTGNKTEKFSAFAPQSPQANPLSHRIYEAYAAFVRFGSPQEQGTID